MSQMGQTRRFNPPSITSGLPLETDIVMAGRHVSKAPTTGHMQCNWSYSIISEARACSVGGAVRPGTFALLRLIIIFVLVDCCAGMLSGFPLYPLDTGHPDLCRN